MLIGDVAVAHLALTLGAQERRVDQDEATDDPRTSTLNHRCGHAANVVRVSFDSGMNEGKRR
jgi:hypothetical protein